MKFVCVCVRERERDERAVLIIDPNDDFYNMIGSSNDDERSVGVVGGEALN